MVVGDDDRRKRRKRKILDKITIADGKPAVIPVQEKNMTDASGLDLSTKLHECENPDCVDGFIAADVSTVESMDRACQYAEDMVVEAVFTLIEMDDSSTSEEIERVLDEPLRHLMSIPHEVVANTLMNIAWTAVHLSRKVREFEAATKDEDPDVQVG